MRISRTQAEGIIQVLKETLMQDRYADKALEKVFRVNRELKANDLGIIAEASYDIIRYWRLLQVVSGSQSLWKILGAWLVLTGEKIPAWKETSSINEKSVQATRQQAITTRAIRESIPDWLDELGVNALGEQWEKELHALNQSPKTCLRVNTLKTSREELKTLLTNEGINTYTDEAFPDALLLQENLPVFQTSAFQDGLFEVQDAASQCVAPFLQPKAGQRVIDACAGTGGKTLHVASLMNNKGRLLGMDVAEWRLEELRKRARRAGVHNMETRVIDSVKTIRKLNGTADCLLLDVPCSGLGVLKRNPDAKWKLKPDYINKLITIQQQLLRDYAWMTKPGGILVYSTCSILPAENHDQVAAFMNAHPNAFEIIEEKSLLPSQGFDGFYMARLKRLV